MRLRPFCEPSSSLKAGFGEARPSRLDRLVVVAESDNNEPILFAESQYILSRNKNEAIWPDSD